MDGGGWGGVGRGGEGGGEGWFTVADRLNSGKQDASPLNRPNGIYCFSLIATEQSAGVRRGCFGNQSSSGSKDNSSSHAWTDDRMGTSGISIDGRGGEASHDIL
jgi:hypothetical protein